MSKFTYSGCFNHDDVAGKYGFLNNNGFTKLPVRNAVNACAEYALQNSDNTNFFGLGAVDVSDGLVACYINNTNNYDNTKTPISNAQCTGIATFKQQIGSGVRYTTNSSIAVYQITNPS